MIERGLKYYTDLDENEEYRKWLKYYKNKWGFKAYTANFANSENGSMVERKSDTFDVTGSNPVSYTAAPWYTDVVKLADTPDLGSGSQE